MQNILLIGGVGSGKGSLVEALQQEQPDLHHIPMSYYAAFLPELLRYYPEKQRLIDELARKNGNAPYYHRDVLNGNAEMALLRYGETFFGELALAALHEGQNVIDNVPKVENVHYLKQKGVYIIGLSCKPETQVERRERDRRHLDLGIALSQLVENTNGFFDIEHTLLLADGLYCTDDIPLSAYRTIAREILEKTRQ